MHMTELTLQDTDFRTLQVKDWVAFDCETHLIAPGRVAPPLVCGTFCDPSGSTVILLREDTLDLVEKLLSEGTTLVGQFIFFDMAVCIRNRPRLRVPIFRAIEQGRILSIDIIEKLRKIARGWNKFDHRFKSKPRYSLEEMVYQYLDEKMTGKKEADAWRYRYAELDGVPLEKWPDAAVQYAMDDALYTARVFRRQQEVLREDIQFKTTLVDLRRQHMAAWGLYLMGLHGFRTDELAVDMLDAELHEHVDREVPLLIDAGVMRYEGPKKDPKRKTVRNMAFIEERVRKAFEGRDEDVPMTEGGKGEVKNPKPKTGVETLLQTRDPDLVRLADIMGDKKLIDTYVPILRHGIKWPINPRYNVLVDSGRTSCAGPNIQNQPRKGGVRESFVPRPGHVFVGCDYHTAELRSLAQFCLEVLGISEMAAALQHTEEYPHGKDLHLVMACKLLHIEYDEAARRLAEGDKEVKNARQLSKVLNFGFPGGLGAPKFLDFAWASYRMRLADTEWEALREAKQLKNQWTDAFPEMKLFFSHINNMISGADSCTMHLIKSGRVRGDVKYTEACNTVFQSLTADGAKMAVWGVVKESWTGYLWNQPIPDDATTTCTDSPLFGFRPTAFIHDEIMGESPLALFRQHAARLAEVMKQAMRWFVDLVPVEADAHAMRRWWKDAEPVHDDAGELQLWSPKDPRKVLKKLNPEHPLVEGAWTEEAIAALCAEYPHPKKVLEALAPKHPLLDKDILTLDAAVLTAAFPDVSWKKLQKEYADWPALHRAKMLDDFAKERTGEAGVCHA